MNKTSIIKNIIFLPKQFSTGNDSVYFLLKESGYFELYNQISERDIFEILIQYLECIDQWLIFSSDKRCNSGFYFTQNDSGKYIVGYLSIEGNKKTTEYLDKFEACAAFIKQEVEEIRNA
jgi:hypothetical protein